MWGAKFMGGERTTKLNCKEKIQKISKLICKKTRGVKLIMKKKFGLLLFVALMAMFVIGCGSNDGEKDNGASNDKGEDGLSGEITVWAHPYTSEGDEEDAMWDEIINSFEEETGVKVNFEQIAWANRDQKILTALAANNGPDVFYAIPDQMPQYADEGMLLDITPYLEDEDTEDFVDTAMAAVTWQDKVYGLPILQSAETLFYNLDVIEEIGEDPDNLPETWEEFEEWAEKAKEAGIYATSFQGGGSMNNTLYGYLWQAGGDVITEDSEVLINTPESVDAFEFINKMYENKWIPEDSITAMEHNGLWDAGKLLSINGSGASIQRFLELGQNVVIAPPMKNREQATYGTTGMFVVPSISENKDASVAFLQHMTNADNQRSFNATTQYIPTRESAKDIYDDHEFLEQLASYTEYALPGVIHPKGRDIMPMIQAELQTMMEGDKTPQEAADAAAESIKAAVSN